MSGPHRILEKQPRPPAPESVDDTSVVPDEQLQEWLHQAGVDTPGTLAKVLEIPDESMRNELLEWILAAWTSEDRAPALAWLRQSLPSMSSGPAEVIIDLIVGGWAFGNPLEAMAWTSGNLTEPWREIALRNVAGSWALSAPEAMGEWIKSQPSPQSFWTEELIQGLIPTNPERAMEWCDSLANPDLAEATRLNVIQSWLLSSPAGADAYLKDHPALMPDNLPENPPPPR
ncbi:MAG: hypothetical protein V4689_10370 [Verrucomicrobiota bacterium]